MSCPVSNSRRSTHGNATPADLPHSVPRAPLAHHCPRAARPCPTSWRARRSTWRTFAASALPRPPPPPWRLQLTVAVFCYHTVCCYFVILIFWYFGILIFSPCVKDLNHQARRKLSYVLYLAAWGNIVMFSFVCLFANRYWFFSVATRRQERRGGLSCESRDFHCFAPSWRTRVSPQNCVTFLTPAKWPHRAFVVNAARAQLRTKRCLLERASVYREKRLCSKRRG